MRTLIILLGLVLICACSSVTPPKTPASPGANPTATGAIPTVTPSPSGTLSPDLVPFDEALLPENANDLSMLHSPTIYRMDLHLDPSLSRLSGQESVAYTNRTADAMDQIYFRLFPNYPSPGSSDKESVTSLRVDGVAVTPTLESQDTALRVPLAKSLLPGSTANLELQFDLSVPVSSSTHYADLTNAEGIITLPSAYPLIPAYDEKGWHTEVPPPYGDLVYADASFYDVRITAPFTMTVIASGSAVETTRQGDDVTWHYIGAPMRDFDVNLSAVLSKTTVKEGDVDVNAYYLQEDESAAPTVLRAATDALRVFEKRIGPYPFKELDVVESPTLAGGIEYPGVVVIADRLYRDPRQSRTLEFDVAHEVAHQWWYAQVGDDQVNTPWMDEAFAQYSCLIYFQDIYGPDVADNIARTYFQGLYDRAKGDSEDKPVGLPVSAYTEKQYGEIVYGKGPLFFDAVRKQIGDEKFYGFMQTYYQRFKYKIAKPEDMLQTIDEVSGQRVDALYDQWIVAN